MKGEKSRARTFLIAIGCADAGPLSRLRSLPGVSADLTRIQALFVGRLGFAPVTLSSSRAEPGVSTAGADGAQNLNLSAQTIEQGLHEWQRRVAPGAGDSVVFYFTGHGINHGATHYLCTRDYDAQRPSTGLETRRLSGLLPKNVRRLWIVLDVCRAGDGAASLCEAIARDRELYKGSVWFLAACGQTTALDQAFSQAFVASAERFISRGGCHAQAELIRSVQKRLGGERAPQRLVPSFYGTESFNFFGETSRQTTLARSLTRLVPTLVKLGLPGIAGWASSRNRVREKGRADKPAQLANASPRAHVAPRLVLPRAGRIVGAVAALLLASLGLWALLLARGTARFDVRGRAAESARVAPSGSAKVGAAQAKAPAPRLDRVWIPGGTVTLGTDRSVARASYGECVAQGACAMSFAESPFADEVGEARAHLGPFWLARTEVTNQEYAQFLSERRAELESTFASPEQASLRDRAGHLWAFLGRAGTQATLPLVLHDEGQVALADLTRARDPITHVTWFGAVAFCAARGGRLPSEAEWALAAQGEARTFPWGEAELQDCRGASFGRNSERECGALGASPMPVATGTRDISPEGVYDLGGNVSEWTSTVFDVHAPARYRAGCSSAQKEAGSCRVVRGGSYWDARIFLRGATRSALDVSAFWRALGFRCAFEETR